MGASAQFDVGAAIRLVSSNPSDPETHKILADAYARAGHAVPAIACLRTALALGDASATSVERLRSLYAALAGVRPAEARSTPDHSRVSGENPAWAGTGVEPAVQCGIESYLARLDHNRHYRFRTLAEEARSLVGSSGASLLDVGGGDGALCLFVPEFAYALAEPATNGISGISLPFADDSFDVVCACHVLEHVPPPDRHAFLDELCSKARKALILLNPFEVEGSRTDAQMTLLAEITRADWVFEHMECGLPKLEDLHEYAALRDLQIEQKANGSMLTTTAHVLASHYAYGAGRAAEFASVNEYFNEFETGVMTSEALPTAYLVTLRLS